jgi:hypothetical protein
MIRKKSSYYGHRREFARKCVRQIARKEYPARKLIALVVRWLHVVFNFFFFACAGCRVRSVYFHTARYEGEAT